MFDNIIGHEFQKNLLTRAAKEGLVAHAYLFSGPDGVGKKLMALEFAKALNCTADKAQSNAGECECGSCNKVEKGIHPDVVVVQYEGINNIKVDQVRDGIEDKLFLKPFEGAFKIVIVDESERMNRSAQNAFLKTLEEPPPNSIIILLTSRPSALLPTIRSRCQVVGFSALSQETIVRILENNSEMPEEELELSARLSSGSPGLALRLEKDLVDWRRDLLLGIVGLSSRSASGVTELTESMPMESNPEDSEKLKLAIEFISLWLRDLIMLKIEAEEKHITHTDIIDESIRVAQALSTDEILKKHESLEHTWNDIFYANANKRLSLENLFINLAMRS